MKRCIVISDSFKGSLSSRAICAIHKERIPLIFPGCEVIALPVADGGEGTCECFLEACGGERVEVEGIQGPYGAPIRAAYARLADGSAVIEMAAAAGLPLVAGRKNPMLTTTYGVGQLLRHAIDHGAARIVLGLGGSATNDGGCGCAAALGVRFYDEAGQEFLPVGESLARVANIDCSAAKELLAGISLTAMCDIDNPMHGENGAAYVFGPQKGADEAMVRRLDEGLRSLDRVIARCLGLNVASLPGAGAAGAFGAGCIAFLGATLARGIEVVLDTVHFDELLRGTDVVFTGEGQIDAQSLRGKVICGVAKRSAKAGVPVIAIVGNVADNAYDAYDIGVSAIFSINRLAIPRSEAKRRSSTDYTHTLDDVLRCWKAAQMSRH